MYNNSMRWFNEPRTCEDWGIWCLKALAEPGFKRSRGIDHATKLTPDQKREVVDFALEEGKYGSSFIRDKKVIEKYIGNGRKVGD